MTEQFYKNNIKLKCNFRVKRCRHKAHNLIVKPTDVLTVVSYPLRKLQYMSYTCCLLIYVIYEPF